MKEFKRWYKNSGNAWSFSTNSTNEPKFRVAWKAALRWALNRESSWEIEEELENE